MLKDENAPIRYLMKEMDPSEELLMERAMMEDDDLLIEVESLRQTLKRLDKLPQKNPPAHVSESVIEYAAERAESRQPSYIISFNPVKYAAAAVLVIGASLAGFWVIEQSGNANSTQADAAMGNTAIPSLNISTSGENLAEPWVDKKDILYFQDQYNSSSAEYDSILNNSMQKLTPLSNPSFYGTGTRPIQMTGTGIRQ